VRILIIDEDEFLAYALRDLLRRDGHDAEAAHTGLEAVRRALDRAQARQPFHVIVSSVHLTGVNGIRMVTRIRREELLRETAVVLTSIDEGGEIEREALEGGADLFLRKPMAAGEMVARVMALQGLQRDADSGALLVEGPVEGEDGGAGSGGSGRRVRRLKRGRIGTSVRRKALKLPPLPEEVE